jgi:hypothetical protein
MVAFVLAALVGVEPGSAQDPPLARRDFIHSPTSEYKKYEMSGFIVMASPTVVRDRKACDQALGLLYTKLAEIKRIVPRAAYEKIKGTKVWVERDNPENTGAVYHPSAAWLQQNGYNTDKEKGVEIGNIRNFVSWVETTQPMMVLHEVAHAYHDQVLSYKNPVVSAAFQAAVKSEQYELVQFVSGGKKRHYGLNNDKEFFAEASEAYFGCNDFYPFDRHQLSTFDRPTYEMLVGVWGLPSGESRTVGTSATAEVLKGMGRTKTTGAR